MQRIGLSGIGIAFALLASGAGGRVPGLARRAGGRDPDLGEGWSPETNDGCYAGLAG